MTFYHFRILISSASRFGSTLLLLKVIHQPNHITQRIRTEISPSDLVSANEDDDVIPGIEVTNNHIKRDIVLGADFVSVVSVDD